MALAKVSSLVQLRRIFSSAQYGIVRVITNVLIWANILFYISTGLANIFACTPRQASWDPMIQGRCINVFSLLVASSALNVVSDVAILLLPIICTWRLVLPLRRKLAIYVVFATGAL